MVDRFYKEWLGILEERDPIKLTREGLIEWLKWNDPKGIYLDEESILEYGQIMTYEEAYWAVLKELD
jgi:hypothetical protein